MVKGNIRLKKVLSLVMLGLAAFWLTACGQAEPVKSTPVGSSQGLVAPSGKITPAATIAPVEAVIPVNSPPPPPNQRIAIGNTAPDFSLTTLDNETVKLSQFRGKPVLINFWATWCPPCREELPLLVKTHQANIDRLVILGVDMDKAEDTGIVRDRVREVGIEYLTLLDPKNEVTNRYQVRAYPTTLFLDKNGVIQRITVGQLTEDTLKAALERIYSIN
ncbi:MAG: thiol:disulfide interchange protein [Chloroflexi bacterium]|nr:thiol:disulfide interchange protein [Chloroflexota bacterium]